MGLVPGTGEALWDLWVLEGLSGLCLKERGVDPPRTGWATLSLARGEPATPASSPPAQAQQAANSCFGSQFPDPRGEAPPGGRPGRHGGD